ncbi:epsin [Diabrotica virgifera virgifera]|uniref:Epsin n=1 Tax=Diabrotica virgifera virgifera TaxID=50390 RepID=A0A6P7FED1_DIAVI|nr:epsin [Diabrotica virgifera virgifera]
MWRLLPIITVLIATISLGFSAEESKTGSPDIDIKNLHDTSNGRDKAFSDDTDNKAESQNSFYPSFSPFQNQPLGHSRPFYYNQQEAAYSQRTPYQNTFDNSARFSGYKDDYNYNAPKNEYASVLGSGNFGVIPGGTFYNDNDENSNYNNYDSFFQNGHGRPAYYYAAQSNPKPYQQEQFANFRDFADINTPNDRSYSQYVVVYAPKKNDTNKEDNTKEEKVVTRPVPRNIIESLTLIDLEHPTTETVLERKLSKSKRKLALLQPEKKHMQKSLKKLKTKELEEPLIALS